MNTAEIIRLLESQNEQITKSIILDLIKEKRLADTDYKTLYSEYKGDVPILNREKPESIPDYKALNKIASGLRGLFVLQGTAFTVGKSSKVIIEDEKTLELVKDFRDLNQIHSKDAGLLQMGCVCGQSGRLLFVDKEAKFRVKNLNSWEYLVVKDATTDFAQFGIIYYEVEDITVNSDADNSVTKTRSVTNVEFYDKKKIQFFTIDGNGMRKTKDDLIHGFDSVPIVQYENDKLQGDFYEERSQIDAYDLLLSIEQDELEDLRTSYMVFSGAEPSEEQMENAKFTGAFGSEDPDFKVTYLEKEANAERTRTQLERLRNDAFTSANRVDFRDDKSNAQSGYARVLELQTLEDDCSLKRVEMQRVSNNMYRILASGYSKMTEKLECGSIITEYASALPLDLTYYSNFLSLSYGKIPLEILYSQLPFIENVEEAVKMFNKEVTGLEDIEGS